jgi:hypothetical protein
LKLLQRRPLKALGLPRLASAIKGRPTLSEHSDTSNAPPLSPSRGSAAALPSRGSATGETPLHRLSNRRNPVIELACPSFPSPAPWSELSGTGPGRRGFSLEKQFLEIPISGTLHLGPSSFSISTLQSLILQLGPWNLKNNSKKFPSLKKIHKNSHKTSKFHVFSTTTPNLVIPSPKFSGSLLLSFYALI